MKQFGLPAGERLKNKKYFELIFSSGRTIFSSDKSVRAAYIIEAGGEQQGIKVAFAVGKKLGFAVWRNRVKRLLRESYRLNKGELLTFCKENKILVKVVLSPNLINQKKARLIYLNDLLPGVADVLSRIKRTLQ